MSVVTGVVVTLGVLDERCVQQIQDWLASNNSHSSLLRQLDQDCGGNKHPQFTLLAGGFNYFAEYDFVRFMSTLRLEMPENCVVLLQPEEGATRVWRADRLNGWLT